MAVADVPLGGWPIKVHHVGTLVQDIEDYLAGSFWSPRSDVVYDPLQKARLCLVSITPDDDQLVELIEPVGEDSPTIKALKKGQKLHHLCFELPTIELANAFIRAHHLLPVTHWQKAVLFQERPVRFAYTRNRELVEFVADEFVTEQQT
jgi:hypothetical protein